MLIMQISLTGKDCQVLPVQYLAIFNQGNMHNKLPVAIFHPGRCTQYMSNIEIITIANNIFFHSSPQSSLDVRSILQQIPFEFDAHIDTIQLSRRSHQQFKQDFFATAYTSVMVSLTAFYSMLSREQEITILLGFLCCHYRVTTLIYLHKNFGMILLCTIGSLF